MDIQGLRPNVRTVLYEDWTTHVTMPKLANINIFLEEDEDAIFFNCFYVGTQALVVECLYISTPGTTLGGFLSRF